MDYTEFFDATDVETYKRVKRGTMALGRTAREIAAWIVGGDISENGREIVLTDQGMFCLVMAHNSLNTTERWAVEREGYRIVVMGDDGEMRAWFKQHGHSRGLGVFKSRLRSAMRNV